MTSSARVPTLVVVVPTVLGGATLGGCLSSLEGQSVPHQVVVVSDGAPAVAPFLRKEFPRASLVELHSNRGFCAAANAGLRHALLNGAEWALLLNDDTALDPTCLEVLLERGEDPTVGLVAPLLLDYTDRKRIDSFGIEVNLLGSGRDQGKGLPLSSLSALETEVAAATGGALLIRRAVLEEVGLLDEGYGFYFEDVDLCLGALDRGWHIATAPEARVFHRHSASIVHGSPHKAYYLARNQVRLVLKTFPWPHVGYALPLSLGRLGLRLASSLARLELRHASAYGRALASLTLAAPNLAKGRRPMQPKTFERIKRCFRWERPQP